jgi:hypothetical protein
MCPVIGQSVGQQQRWTNDKSSHQYEFWSQWLSSIYMTIWSPWSSSIYFCMIVLVIDHPLCDRYEYRQIITMINNPYYLSTYLLIFRYIGVSLWSTYKYKHPEFLFWLIKPYYVGLWNCLRTEMWNTTSMTIMIWITYCTFTSIGVLLFARHVLKCII